MSTPGMAQKDSGSSELSASATSGATKASHAAHTPGPWTIGGIFSPRTPDEHCSVWSGAPEGCVSGDQVAQYMKLSDARLIAAAPDLLAALQALLDTPALSNIGTVTHTGKEVIRARATIAKATGAAS